jgi:glycosyltransferase involved in cell wall biosynthesis
MSPTISRADVRWPAPRDEAGAANRVSAHMTAQHATSMRVRTKTSPPFPPGATLGTHQSADQPQFLQRPRVLNQNQTEPPEPRELRESGRALNVLLLNLAMDANHTALGFTTAWTNALARRAKHVSVITMMAGELSLEPNVTVRSLGKERGFTEPRRLLEFYRHVYTVLREREIDVCFAHMAPLFASLFAPVARAKRIPILLWYAHGATSRTMRLAHALADRAVTSTAAAFNVPSDKLFVIGQGIDIDQFRPPAETASAYENTVISIGRLTRSKRIDEMLAALALVRAEHGLDLRLELTGEPLTEADVDYVELLHGTAGELGVADAVTFAGRVPFPDIPARYHRGSVFVNLSETRSIDKAILESMASGCIPISRNESFRELAQARGLDSLVPGPGAEALAGCMVRVVELSPSQRRELTRRLRGIVEEEHSLETLADRLMAHLTELAA